MAKQPQSPFIEPDERAIKKRQITLVTLGLLAVVSFIGFAYYQSLPDQPPGQQGREKVITKTINNPGPVSDGDLWRAKGERDITRLQQQTKDIQGTLDRLIQRMERSPDKPDYLSGRRKSQDNQSLSSPASQPELLPLPPAPEKKLATSVTSEQLLPPPPEARSSRSTYQPNQSGNPVPGQGFFVMDIAQSELEPLADGNGKTRKKTVHNYLPPGTFIKTRLLSGLDAPTGGQAQNDPVPLLVNLSDNGQLPNGFRSRVKHCFITLAGYGNISDERVYGRTEKLSCVFNDETVFDTTIKGYLSGEDGKAGLRGRLVSKQGQLIAYSLLSGLGGGIGKGLADSFTTVSASALGNTASVDPQKVAEYGVAEGFGSALDRISRWYLERADETYPIIEIGAGRTPEIVLLEGVFLDQGTATENSSRPVVTEANAKKAGTLEVSAWQN